MTVTPSAKSASDVSGNGSGIDPHIPQAFFNNLVTSMHHRCRWTHTLLILLMSKEPCVVYQMNSSDVKCYWSDGLVKNALFDNILYTINKFYFDIDL